jgi:hypothetical protein
VGGIQMRTYIENKERADMDIIVDSFIHDLKLYEGYIMPIITIYKNTTKDYPGKFVARLFDIKPGEVMYTRYIMLSDSLEWIRKQIPPNMTRFQPSENDDPVVLETWI